jgi:hypothetical protein
MTGILCATERVVWTTGALTVVGVGLIGGST